MILVIGSHILLAKIKLPQAAETKKNSKASTALTHADVHQSDGTNPKNGAVGKRWWFIGDGRPHRNGMKWLWGERTSMTEMFASQNHQMIFFWKNMGNPNSMDS